MPTVRRTWFSGRIESASMTGAIRNFWIADAEQEDAPGIR